MRLLKTLLLALIAAAGLLAGAAAWWLQQPLALQPAEGASLPLPVQIATGSSARKAAQSLADAGVQAPPLLLYAWFRASGHSRAIQAGYYELDAGLTPRSLLDKLVRGEQALRSLTLIEGWNFRDMLKALRESPDLTHDLDGLTAEDIMARIGYPGRHPEGLFFPDTYRMVRGAPASTVLRQAAQAMEQRLALAWAQRAPDAQVHTPDEALILASIIEKETGVDSDRPLVGGVFNNRLRIGMRLQTDPTVIYGLGERFDGNLRRADLLLDTPYNSYTRAGLPPTPIAMPGWASLMAAVQPAQTTALYFVARGDGSSHFSATLAEHAAAVRQYQLK